MVIDEPDAYEIEDMDEPGIGIFEPGAHFEQNMDWGKLSQVILYVGLGWVAMFALTFVIMIPLLAFIPLFEIITNPWALLILTIAELGFIIPVIFYVKKQGITLRSIGIKNMTSGKDIVLGFIFGSIMLGSNLAISYFMTEFMPGVQGDESLFNAPTGQPAASIWLISWTIAMFAIVGFSEEIVFRGFLQRRMEMYYRDKGSKNYKLISLIITSFIFSAIHLDLLGLGTRFILGILLGYLAQRRNYSIIGPTVAHGFNNSAVVYLAYIFS